MKILALLTGRGGSTLKNKNILKLNRKPILSYPCLAAKKCKEINFFFASSDNKKILNYTKKYNFESIKRPKKYSLANSKHYNVLVHALKYLKKKKINPDIVVVLMANAPIIKSKWITDCINILKKDKSVTCCLPVSKDNDKHPFRAKKIKRNGKHLVPFLSLKKKISSNRQDLVDCYFPCHNFWVIRTGAIYKNNGQPPWNFMGKKILPYLIKYSLDIHEQIDLDFCKLILKKID